MILQALTAYYDALARRGEIAPQGWGPAKVSFALCLTADGELERVIDIRAQQQRGKKTVTAPQVLQVPAPVKRSVGILPNFLCDNSGYLLGLDDKGKPQRTADCFAACKTLHESVLTDADSPPAKAILSFFAKWKPEQAARHPALQEYMEDILGGGNLVFRCAEAFCHEDPAIRSAWERCYFAQSDGPEMVCLVTGKKGPVERIHPVIKNVAGAQSIGATLVGFNAPSFCSFEKEQNYNAPVSKYAAFAYTTALNHLLADREHVYRVGDTTVVCWAKNAQADYSDVFGCAFFGQQTYDFRDIENIVKKLSRGETAQFDKSLLNPEMEFYILGLAPNSARLSVRFFLRGEFGDFLRNVQAHQDRLEITRPSFDQLETLPLWKVLDDTVNQNARDKAPSPILAGELLRAVLTNTRYPATLLNGVTLRIRAEHEITRGRAAILKAYYLKNTHPNVPKEVLQVSLNPDSHCPPYVLGRLFSVLEAIQQAANPGINATIKDKYFNSASSTPARVFPTLVNLAQKHLRKLEAGTRTYYDKQLTELMGRLPQAYPDHLSLPQQGSFQLGYYHQTQKRYEKKEDAKNV